jgi:hypothetical protein
MNVASTALDRFQQLTENHANQFEPQLAQIRQRLDRELAELQQQETDLVQTQNQALAELRQAIHTDARFLLATPQFQSFVEGVLPKEPSRYYFKPQVQISKQVADWLVHQSTDAIGISDYAEDVDHDAYDDERTHTMYSYSAAIQWGDQSGGIHEIQMKRVYGISHNRSYDPEDQIEQIVDCLSDFDHWDGGTEEQQMLAMEMGYLIYYACTLLKLQPQSVQLVYDSTALVE